LKEEREEKEVDEERQTGKRRKQELDSELKKTRIGIPGLY
jgi:hypothetical protein